VQGAPTQPLRLICWPLFNGADPEFFYPAGADAAALSPITEPLRKYAGLLTFVREVSVVGSANHHAIRSVYTGADVSGYLAPDPTVPSVDQLVASHIAKTSPTPMRSVHLGVIPASSIAAYQTARSMLFFAPERVHYEANPVLAYDRLFGGGAPVARPTGPDLSGDSRALLDAELQDLGTRLANVPGELGKLDRHRNAFGQLRAEIEAAAVSPVVSGPFASVEKLRPTLQGNDRDAYKHDLFDAIFDAQVDNLARVLVGGLSRVVTLQAGSADSNLIVPVGPGYPHHDTSHGNAYVFSAVQQYYFTKVARLLAALDVPDPLDPGRTVLDNSLLLMLGECLPTSHSPVGVPTLLVGKLGGRVRVGATVQQPGITNRQVMATVLRAFGLEGAHFGSTVVDGVLS
jgi:hypothetical protein